MLRPLSIAALLACNGDATASDFTMCGMPIQGASPSEAARLRVVERASLYAIEAIATRKDGSPFLAHELCRALYSIQLRIADDVGTSKTCECEVPPKLCGHAHLAPGDDYVELLRLPPEQLCFAHEAMHIAQLRFDGEAEPRHEHWEERGLYAAEVEASRRISEALP